ncbi:P-loop containing nucleoside triphosphate hydrolase protein [Cristinia sonorae]|uniref:P-loop containing nucleoside triphosphate hydrolase protein n=1 Tax=Cristinia sonorae TaxID=1940300 RepID=A0A8K0UG65_9AGAR|nr:P-loop containing nucleoside triphosphate hydrolase protein [Cristinia sonorae]
MMSTEIPAVQHISSHVLTNLARHRHMAPTRPIQPLFVGVQGPQGSGKSFLSSRLKKVLTSPPHSLSVVVLSIDDLYLPHDGLVALAQAHPDNTLLKGRGQPGTHDVALGTEILQQLKEINSTDGAEVNLPVFEKSLHGGEGDRLHETVTVGGPVDVVIMEGWCLGFHPITKDEIQRRWDRPVKGLDPDFFRSRGFRREDVEDVNERLKEYLPWWNFFSVFVQVKPAETHPYVHIYKWRLQQEHNMKAANGGKGMTDAQVEAFIDRYIPGYVFFGDGVTKGALLEDGTRHLPPWVGNSLQIQIDENREVTDTIVC